MTQKFDIPQEILKTLQTLNEAGFEAYLVGGCVRDLLMEREPKDWDITTNAKPEEIIKLFSKTVYENNFGTVAVFTREIPAGESANQNDIVEVTPYRLEAKYSDHRHPDEVIFSNKLEDDLKRRDFTVNAMAIGRKGPASSLKDIDSGWHLIDLYNGQQDIKDKILRTVGNPDERFKEDALRLLRAIRFSTQLNFTVSQETSEAILKNARLIKEISGERIRDEFVKIINSESPMIGIVMMQKLGLLKNIIPELEEGIGCDQKGEHVYDVWEHLLRSLQHAADKKWPFHVRLSALFHDIGKPPTRRDLVIGSLSLLNDPITKRKAYTFYGHEVVGARMVKDIMARLKFSKKDIDTVTKLVRYHMFFSDPDQITLSAVRRLVANVGPDLVWDLMNVRMCDRIGMGRPKEEPYRLRKFESMIEEAMRAPVSVGMLKIDGNKIMEVTGEKAGPRLGWTLHALLEEALENPDINTEEYLNKRVKELAKLSDKELKKLGEAGKEKKGEEEEKELGKIRSKYKVK